MNTFPNIPIVYEDDDLLVINKPGGVIVNRSQTVREKTLQDWAEERIEGGLGKEERETSTQEMDNDKEEGESDELFEYGTPDEIFRERSGIAHRLDKETSGILLIAKHPETLRNLLAQFKARETQKTYLALVHGKFTTQKGEINLPIGRNSKYRLQYTVREAGRESVTEYKVLNYFPHLNMEQVLAQRTEEKKERYKNSLFITQSANFKKNTKRYQGFSLVEVTPKTGRTHQIRVHMMHIKHPLVGDKVYNGRKRVVLDQVWCPRHFLHAQSITLTHPTTKQTVTYAAPLPSDLEQVLQCVTE